MELESLKYIIPAASGLVGVIIGSLFTLLGKKSETKLRVIEKVFDKRLKAHEDILDIAKQMRATVSTHFASDGLNFDTYPGLLYSKNAYEKFNRDFYVALNSNSHWISIELFRQLNFIQDYLGNVTQKLLKIDESSYPKFGLIVKQDFIDLAAELEAETLKFFEKDLYNINLKATKGHHKWPKEYTIERLNNTELIKKSDPISTLK